MPKTEVTFFCQQCGYESKKWIGRCPGCQEWNSFVEEREVTGKAAPTPHTPQKTSNAKVVPITEVESLSETRTATGILEFDRVIGGGIVPGSVVLVGGDPGIGKSTLLLQVAKGISDQGARVLYISGEESPQQIKLRAKRLGANSPNLLVYSETALLAIEQKIKEVGPDVAIVDSIQTLYHDLVTSAPGSVAQVRECAGYITRLAKESGIPIFIVTHVTKEGNIAGPKLLEHIVDTVLYFEGEQHRHYRILRATKNRFGSLSEIGIFEMEQAGLREVSNPSMAFIEEREKEATGSVVTVALEGTRPLLVEIQALVSHSNAPYPTRRVTGLDFNRTAIVLAILEKRGGLKVYDQDVFLNVAGGVTVEEPAVDLAAALAIASSIKNRPVDSKAVVLGELGLGGEVRSVEQLPQRLVEASRLGFSRAIAPALSKNEVPGKIALIPVKNLREALEAAIQ